MSRKDKRAGESAMSFFSFQDIVCSITGILIFVTLMISMELISRAGPAGSVEEAELQSKMSLETAKRRLQRLKTEYDQIVETQEQLTGQPITQARIDEMARQVDELEKTRRLVSQKKNLDKMEQARLAEQLRDARKRNEELQKQVLAAQQSVARDENRNTIPVPAGSDKNLKPVFLELGTKSIVAADFADPTTVRKLNQFDGTEAAVQVIKWAQTRDAKAEYFVILVRPAAIDLFGPIRRELTQRGYAVSWEAWPDSKDILNNKEKPITR